MPRWRALEAMAVILVIVGFGLLVIGIAARVRKRPEPMPSDREELDVSSLRIPPGAPPVSRYQPATPIVGPAHTRRPEDVIAPPSPLHDLVELPKRAAATESGNGGSVAPRLRRPLLEPTGEPVLPSRQPGRSQRSNRFAAALTGNAPPSTSLDRRGTPPLQLLRLFDPAALGSGPVCFAVSGRSRHELVGALGSLLVSEGFVVDGEATGSDLIVTKDGLTLRVSTRDLADAISGEVGHGFEGAPSGSVVVEIEPVSG